MLRRGRYTCDNCGAECHPAHIKAVVIGTINGDGWLEVEHEQHYCDRCADALLPKTEERP